MIGDLIPDHPQLGREVRYTATNRQGRTKVVQGIVDRVREGCPLTDIKTGKVAYGCVEMRIKPNDGSRAIWTHSMKPTHPSKEDACPHPS